MLDAHDVARYFIERGQAENTENDLSNLKLQKLCYYAEGFHLAIFGRPLFRQPLEAWPEGPVVSSIYHAYKTNGARPIEQAEAGDPITDERVVELLDAVYGYYGQFSAWTLRNRTHLEPPWVEARPTRSNLNSETMAKFFRTQLELLDSGAETTKEAVRHILESNAALAEGTRRGREDVAAGRVHKLGR